MPSTREQTLSNLDIANRHRITKANLRKQLRAGQIDLWPVLVSRYTQSLSVLEVLGLAFVGRGCVGHRPGRLALTVAAAMPFSITHGTTVGQLSYPQMSELYREFAALWAEEAASVRDSSRASL